MSISKSYYDMGEGTHCILLRRCDLLNSEGVVEKTVAGEVLLDVLLDELDTKIGVVNALDLVTDTTDEFVGLSGVVDEFTRSEAGVTSVGEHDSSLVESTTETATDGEETGCE